MQKMDLLLLLQVAQSSLKVCLLGCDNLLEFDCNLQKMMLISRKE